MTQDRTPSTTGNVGHFWQCEQPLQETGYPVDTVRIEIEIPIEVGDRESLNGLGWAENEKRERKKKPRMAVEKLSKKRWTRSLRDDLRVIAYENKVAVEVSLPRFFGHENSRLDMVPCDGLTQFLAFVAEDLLPITTKASSTPWVITRLDLAIDFQADIIPLVNFYRDSRVKGGQMAPVCRSGTEFTLRYRKMTLSFYDKWKQFKVKRKDRSGMAPGHCRFEVQVRNTRRLANLGKVLAPGEDAWIRVPEKVSPNRRLRISLDRVKLLRCALDAIALLEPPTYSAKKVSKSREILLHAINSHEDIKSMAMASLKGATLKRAIEHAAALKCEPFEMDLMMLSLSISTHEWRRNKDNIFRDKEVGRG